MADRHKTPPFGLFGGAPGRLGAFLVDRGARGVWRDFCTDSGKRSPSKFANVVIRDGDRVRIRTPGGGGYGPAREREPEQIDQDLLEGWITPDGAAADYGRR